MPDRSRDWFAQAERDLAQAEASAREGRHEWSCFAAHQAAEKAVKALHLRLGEEGWGHVISRLLQELPLPLPDGLADKARGLDLHYVPTRYPNGHPEGPPFEHYGSLQSNDAIRFAHDILEFVRAQMASAGNGPA